MTKHLSMPLLKKKIIFDSIHKIKPSKKYHNLSNKKPLDKMTRVSSNLTKVLNPTLTIEILISAVAYT